MPSRRPTTASSVVFSLKTYDQHARNILLDPANIGIVRSHDHYDMIDVCFTLNRHGGLSPATMGRKGDVKIVGPFIANIQVSFELHMETGEIMLVDRSPGKTCRVYYGDDEGKIRGFDKFEALVLTPAISNIAIHFGGSAKYKFLLEWCNPDAINLEAWKSLATRTGQVQTPKSHVIVKRLEGCQHPEKRFLKQEELAANYPMLTRIIKCVDAYTGHCVVVKQVEVPSHEVFRETRREITTDLNHPHIIQFLQVEILVHRFNLVMELQDGDLHSLASTPEFMRRHQLLQDGNTVSRPLMHQMLQALDYLVSKDIIHRDIKPKNILYRRINGSYHYRLADFGIATIAPHAIALSGTQGFMAPEVGGMDSWQWNRPHTTRIDVWGLARSFCHTFRLEPLKNEHNRYTVMTTVHPISHAWSDMLEQMLDPNPFRRVSAGHVLTLMFNGEGRVTEE